MNTATPDCIRLTGLVIDCIIGIYPSERVRRQPLSADAALFLSTTRCGVDVDLSSSIDYAKIVGEIRFLIETCRFHLLETAAEALCAYLAAPPQRNPMRAQVDAVSLKLSKPQALMNGVQPSVEITRQTDAFSYETIKTDFGSSLAVFKSRDCAIHRIELSPGCALNPGDIFPSTSELILTSGLTQGGTALRSGSAYTWAHAASRTYENPTKDFQTLICVERNVLLPEEHSLNVNQSRAFFSNSVTPHYYPPEA
jgi:dihydroneopterin aldolase